MTDVFLDLTGRLEILKAAPQADYNAYRAFGGIIHMLADPVERTRWCEAAIACHPHSEDAFLGIADAWAHAGMGERARFLGVVRLGVGLLERALKVTTPGPKRTLIHSNLCFLYNEIGRHDLAETHGRLAEGCPNHLYHIWLTESLFAQHKFDTDPVCGIDLSVFRRDSMQALADETARRWHKAPPPPTDDFTLVVSVDSSYFRTFAVAQALNLHALGSRVGVHYHVINPDDGIPDLAATLQRRTPGLRLQVSYIQQPDFGPSNKVYYACARLLVARTLMERYNTNPVITDADVLFRTPPENLLASTAGCDVAGIVYPGEPLCNRYNASFFAIRRTLAGTYFLRTVEEFLYTTFNRGMIWMIDQMALYFCERRVTEVTRGGLKMQQWPEALVAIHHYPLSDLWEGYPEAPIWSGATAAKWRDTYYTRYRDSLLQDYGFSFDPS